MISVYLVASAGLLFYFWRRAAWYLKPFASTYLGCVLAFAWVLELFVLLKG